MIFFFQYSTISLSLRVFRTVRMGLSQNASWSVGGSRCQPRGAPSRQVVTVQSLITEAGGRRRQGTARFTATPGFFLPTTSASRPGAQVRQQGRRQPRSAQATSTSPESHSQQAKLSACTLKKMDHPAFLQQDMCILQTQGLPKARAAQCSLHRGLPQP